MWGTDSHSIEPIISVHKTWLKTAVIPRARITAKTQKPVTVLLVWIAGGIITDIIFPLSV